MELSLSNQLKKWSITRNQTCNTMSRYWDENPERVELFEDAAVEHGGLVIMSQHKFIMVKARLRTLEEKEKKYDSIIKAMEANPAVERDVKIALVNIEYEQKVKA